MEIEKPSFIPNNIFVEVYQIIYGAPAGNSGLINLLTSFQEHLVIIKKTMNNKDSSHKKDFLGKLFTEFSENVKETQLQIDALKRTISDPRMLEFYEIIKKINLSHEQVMFLFKSFLNSLRDYKNIREKIQEAKEIKKRVSKHSKLLAEDLKLMRNFKEIIWPLEFRYMEHAIANVQLDEKNPFCKFWNIFKSNIVTAGRNTPSPYKKIKFTIGDNIEILFTPLKQEKSYSESSYHEKKFSYFPDMYSKNSVLKISIVLPKKEAYSSEYEPKSFTDEEKQFHFLKCLWQFAPTMHEVILALHRSAEKFNPENFNYFSDSLNRQASINENKTILRNMLKDIIDSQIFPLNNEVKKALSILVTVGLDIDSVSTPTNDHINRLINSIKNSEPTL